MEIIFVHGALVRDGAWWWAPAGDTLRSRTGVSSSALLLPSCGETRPDDVAGGLTADAAALRRRLDEAEPGSVVLIGHSYGGTVIAEAGHHPAVARLVYISSYLPDVGQAQGALVGDEPDPVSIRDNHDGTVELSGYDVRSFGARFAQDVDEATLEGAFARRAPQALGAFATPVTMAGWVDMDSTYLVCLDDRSTTVNLQRRHAARATRSVDLPTGHHPFLSRPDLVADQLEALLAAGLPGSAGPQFT